MTVTVVTSNSTGAGTRYMFSSSSNVFDVPSGVSVITTDTNPAVKFTGAYASDQVDIAGQVIGSDGLDLSGASTVDSIEIAAGGSLTGDSNYALNLTFETGVSQVTNSGEIYGAQSGIYSDGYLDLVNYGNVSCGTPVDGSAVIVADDAVIENYGVIAGVSFYLSSGGSYLFNSGTISSSINDASQSKVGSDVYYNDGTIEATGGASGTSFDGAASSTSVDFWNLGTMRGGVLLGAEVDNFNSAQGYVYGRIQAGSGAAVIIGAINGGAISGGAGDDVLYANTTATAAEDGSQTSLDGSTGDNWLYGDGAFTTFDSGDNKAGTYNQIFGGASQMTGVSGYENNTVNYAGLSSAYKSAYIDLLHGDAYMSTVAKASQATGAELVFEDYLRDVPNVVGSKGGDVVICDNGVDKITSGANGGGDVFYAGAGSSSRDTFAFTAITESTLSNYDVIEGFKVGVDKLDFSALDLPPADVLLSYGGNGASTIYVEKNPASGFNAATDMILSVKASTNVALGYGDLIL